MVSNTIENNVCSEKVSSKYGASLIVRWGAENNVNGEGSGNVYRNNSLGAEGKATGTFAMWGDNQTVTMYAAK